MVNPPTHWPSLSHRSELLFLCALLLNKLLSREVSRFAKVCKPLSSPVGPIRFNRIARYLQLKPIVLRLVPPKNRWGAVGFPAARSLASWAGAARPFEVAEKHARPVQQPSTIAQWTAKCALCNDGHMAKQRNRSCTAVPRTFRC